MPLIVLWTGWFHVHDRNLFDIYTTMPRNCRYKCKVIRRERLEDFNFDCQPVNDVTTE